MVSDARPPPCQFYRDTVGDLADANSVRTFANYFPLSFGFLLTHAKTCDFCRALVREAFQEIYADDETARQIIKRLDEAEEELRQDKRPDKGQVPLRGDSGTV